jgi:opacity protein-like surface antigen
MRLLAAALALAISTAAAAEGYAAFGLSKLRDGRGSSVLLAAGYQFNRTLGAELGYFSPGEVSSDTVGTTASSRSIDTGISLVGTASLPIGAAFSLFADAGVYYLRGEFESHGTLPGGPVSSASGSGLSPTIGGGARWRFTELVAASLRYESIRTKSGLFGDGHDIGNLKRVGAALEFHF